jgi:predicted SAM-dependent methyltransferase
VTKVHLGCWHRHIPGFLHIDLCDMPHIDYKSEISRLPFLPDGSVELIYCSHAFEYLDRDEANNALAEWRRVLRPGGRLRLAVPDFEALIAVYRHTGELKNILGPLYGRMQIDTPVGKVLLYHKTVYDEVSLKALLEHAGYVQPERWDWRNTEHAQIDDHSQAYFPHMQKDSGTLVSLNIEAVKPS